MINLVDTNWKIKSDFESLSDKMISFKENGELLFNKAINGTYQIHSDRIKMDILNHKLEGVVVEDFIFGEIIHDNEKIAFECSCNSYDISNLYMKEFQKVNVGDRDDFSLIHDIYKLIKDYRIEFSDNSRISRSRIKNWIDQFEMELRVPILSELKNIFKKRYCSKKDVKEFLNALIERLTQDFHFKNHVDFLRNSIFLNLQPEEKSQRIMLELFDDLIKEKFGLSLADCGTTSRKYSIYIDDILCTGLTLITDIKDWSEMNFSQGKTNKQAVSDNSTTLVFAYVFLHEKNYRKKVAEMRHKISADVSSKHKMYRLIEIENGLSADSKINLILPLEEGQTQIVKDYQEEIINRVDERANEKGWKIGPNEFFRPEDLPHAEEFFTSAQNRKIIENAFLQKGIQILKNANSHIPNMRALGYSLPSLKDFGFGALCFTWRNVPNNTPLVFWYKGGNFNPLFVVKRGEKAKISFNLTDSNIGDL